MLILQGLVYICCIITWFQLSFTQGQYPGQSVNLRPNEAAVTEIRRDLMYPYDKGDFQSGIYDGSAKLEVTERFSIPMYGFNYNYIWINLNGYLSFSKNTASMKAPFTFPVTFWPDENDPSFIGPFFAFASIGEVPSGTQAKEYPPGVYVRMYPNIGFDSRKDLQKQIDMREAIRRDVQEGMIGATDFEPKHVIIVTWRNVTFGGSDNQGRSLTNTYQLMLTSDEIRTYVVFNYERIVWHSSRSTGGNHEGIGGIPAFVGFNAGNGTRGYEYKPYSQHIKIHDLVAFGNINGKPGRHIFRIDEEILPGSCNYEPPPDKQEKSLLVLSPESGNMLGGTVVNISGPCFDVNQKTVRIKFGDKEVTCTVMNRNLATCVTPVIWSGGYITVVAKQSQSSTIPFSNKYYVENPMMVSGAVTVDREFANSLDNTELNLEWSSRNLTWNRNAPVSINLWGYREYAVKPDLVFITTLQSSTPNSGRTTIDLTNLLENDDGWKRDFIFGLIQVNTSITISTGQVLTPQVWSLPIPLGWYFHKQWERYYGSDWAAQFCKRWDTDDRRLKNFAHDIPRCPCNLEQATYDKGRFAPDFGCDELGNNECYGNTKLLQCFRTGQPTIGGAGQQCCYGKEGDLLMNVDMKEGGIPARAHPFGIYPYDDSTKVPGLSHWYHDQSAYFACCGWQSEMSESCYQFKWRRASQDCIGYQPPNASVVFGDPHIITFDNVEYTFNGKGEFSLVHVNDKAHSLDVQGRFEQIRDMTTTQTRPATVMTSVAAKDNASVAVEVQLRPHAARWRYRLNVIVDGKRVYFDRLAHKMQSFKGVTVYVPSFIHSQSKIIIMFQSGAGVEVTENGGFLSAVVYLPKTFMNITRGLMGNWSSDPLDDLVLPDDPRFGDAVIPPPPSTTTDRIHNQFGIHWMVFDSGNTAQGLQSIFHHEPHRTASYYGNKTFQPEFDPKFKVNMSMSKDAIQRICGYDDDPLDYQCRFDYLVTEDGEFAAQTKKSADEFRKMKSIELKIVTTCGALETPRFGRKSTNKYTINTEVRFECEKNYVLEGSPIRWCYPSGEWSWAEYGITRCLSEDSYYARQAGITSGIVLGILIPIIIGSICLFGFIISKGNTENDSPRNFRGESHKMERVRTTSDSHEVDTKQKSRETEA